MICIYVLKCPFTGLPRYVGKTQAPKTRLSAHISKAKSGQTSHRCARWIRQLLAEGKRPIFEVIFEVPADEDWQLHEKRLIAEHRSNGCELTNLTGGGDGFFEPSPETLRKRGQKRKEDWADFEKRSRYIAALLEANQRPEVRLAKSNGLKAAWADPAMRQSIIQSMNTPEAKAKRSAASLKRYEDPEVGKAQSQKMKELFQGSPLRREKMRAAICKRWETNSQQRAEKKSQRVAEKKSLHAQFLIEQAERLKQRWQDPKHRAKMQAARWTPEKRAEQAARIEARREKMLAARTPEAIAKQAETLRQTWARRKAQQA